MWRNAIISETSLLKTIPDLIMAVFSLSCRDFSQSMFQDSQRKQPQHPAIISATSCLKLSTGNTSRMEDLWHTWKMLDYVRLTQHKFPMISPKRRELRDFNQH